MAEFSLSGFGFKFLVVNLEVDSKYFLFGFGAPARQCWGHRKGVTQVGFDSEKLEKAVTVDF